MTARRLPGQRRPLKPGLPARALERARRTLARESRPGRAASAPHQPCGAGRRATMNPEYLQLLLTRVMPYGKYKGRVIADLPGHYLNWFAREGFPSGELGRLLALMQELDHNGLSSLLDPLRKR